MLRWFLAVGLSGCSLTLSGPDPNRPRNKAPSCDSSKALVAFDGFAAGILFVGGLAAGSRNGTDAIAPIAIGAALLASAAKGNATVNDCRQDIGEYYASRRRLVDDPLDEAATTRPAFTPAVTRTRSSETTVAEQPPTRIVAPQSPRPAAAPPKPAPVAEDMWRDFWREVP